MECEGEWWPGNGHAGDIKDGNDGTLQKGATFAAGKVEKAFSFDGISFPFKYGVF